MLPDFQNSFVVKLSSKFVIRRHRSIH